MDVLALRLAREAGDADSEGGVDPEVKRSWLVEIRDSVDCRRAINTAWMPTSAQTLLRRLYARPEVLAAANRKAGSPLRPDELAALVRPALGAVDGLGRADPGRVRGTAGPHAVVFLLVA